MTVVVVSIAIVILCMPRWLAPLMRRLDPHEAVRISVVAVAIGAFLVELSFVLFAVPAVFSAFGVRSLAVSCHQCHHETIINAMPEITATMMVAIGRLGAKWIPLFGSR